MTRQKCPKATWGKPQDPDAPERPPGKPKGGFPERGLNGAYKVPQAHLPPPNLPRFGGGERPPFCCKPPAPLTITMGQRLIFRPIIVPRPNHRDPPPPQALTFPEHRTAALILSAHPGPFPAIGKGGGGKGQIRPWLPWERFCAQYGLIFGSRRKSIRIQHSQRQGSWGRAPSVFWFLLHE